MNFEDKLIQFEKDKKEFEIKLERLKQEGKLFGYLYDEDSKTFKLKENQIVHVLDIFAYSKSTGFYCGYASLILIPDILFEKIKHLMNEKSMENWMNIIKIINDFDNFLLKDFYKCLDFSSVYDLVDSIELIINKDDVDKDYLKREGIFQFYEECFFKEESFEGYMSFFDLSKEIFIKNKHTEKFFNQKYLRENAPLEYYKKDFYI